MKNKVVKGIAGLGLIGALVLTSHFSPEADFTPSYEGMEIPAISGCSDIVRHDAFTSSYNRKTLIPDWVAYELKKEEIDGQAHRSEKGFSMDPQLKGVQAMREDYSNSGWTKGHMIPSSDVRYSDEAMEETFYFTNICPQSERLNAGDWEYLERQVRNWTNRFGTVYVVTGPIIGDGKYGTIGERQVTVPDAFFKAVATVCDGQWQSIAFVMGNDDSRYYLKDCALSVNDLEELTGIDFFPELDDDIEELVESSYSLKDWNIK